MSFFKNYKIKETNKDRLTVEFKCPMCNKTHTMDNVLASEYASYDEGTLVQNAFPKMNSTNREKFITGMCEVCQKNIFGG